MKCAISGPCEQYQGITRSFENEEELEKVLQQAGIQNLHPLFHNALKSGFPVYIEVDRDQALRLDVLISTPS